MKTALILTTINVPKVLALYRKLGPDVRFFVAGDSKTPNEALTFINDLEDCWVADHTGYKCSDLIGWNNDSRRNIALLEAVKWGAEIIVSVDDDVLPLGQDFFERFEILLSERYSGVQIGTPGRWCDVGRLTMAIAAQRGLPLNCSFDNAVSFVTDVQIGAMQGIILGIPDTDAGTTIARSPFVHSATDILRNGFVINPDSRAVFNSQITAFRCELAPCFAQFYKWQQRNTDIFASLLMRRLMRERELYTYFGPPLCYHARTPRDPRKDLEAERWGTERVEGFSRFLDACVLPHRSIVENLLWLYTALEHAGMYPKELVECATAFLEDIMDVM